MSTSSESLADQLNDRFGGRGFVGLLGLRFTHATHDRIEGTFEVQADHLQPMGLVHGGVYCAVAETLASAGAAVSAIERGLAPVGLENTTSFVRAISSGVVHAVAESVHRGRTTHIWQVAMTDPDQNLLATGRVRLMLIAPKGS